MLGGLRNRAYFFQDLTKVLSTKSKTECKVSKSGEVPKSQEEESKFYKFHKT
jgi:hypothetical protein